MKYIFGFLLFNSWLFNCYAQQDLGREGSLLFDNKKFNEAIVAFEKEAIINEMKHDTNRVLCIHEKIMEVLIVLNQREKFIKYEKIVSPFLKSNSNCAAKFLIYLSSAYEELGEYTKAKKLLEQAQSKIINTGNAYEIGLLFNDKGVLEQKQGEYEYALISFNIANSYYKKLQTIDALYEQMMTTNNIGGTYLLQGNGQLAKKYYEKKLQILDLIKQKAPTEQLSDYYAGTNNILGYNQMLNFNDLVTARKYEQTALQLLKKNPNPIKLARNYLYRGLIEKEAKNYAESINFLKTSQGILGQNPDSEILAQIFSEIGNSYCQLGNYQEALKNLQLALQTESNHFTETDYGKNPSLMQYKFRLYALETLKYKAEALLKLFENTKNINYLLDALSTANSLDDLIDYQRNSFQMQGSKMLLNDGFSQSYNTAVSICLHLYQLTKKPQFQEKAFWFTERNKAVLLNESFRSIKANNFKGIDKSLIEKERYLHQQITIAEAQLTYADSSKLAIWQEKKLKNSEKLQALKQVFKTKFPNYYQLKYNFATIAIPQIQAKLDSQTAFVSYFLGAKSYAFMITKTAAKVVQLTDNLSLENNTKALVSELYRKPGLDTYKGSFQAQSLYNILLKPFEKELAHKTRLIVLRDGNLNFLPFEVLEKSPNDYLVKHFAISYGYSATILFNALNNNKLKSKNNIMAIAPYTSKQHLPSTFRDKTLQPLPASGEEVSQIGGNIYTDQQATKNRFLSTYQQHGIIHFATHAQVDDREAGRSFIAFYPDSSGYKLYTEELYNLSLQKTRLVVLSACETGRGQLHQCEGILSLARAFAYAGCPSVVATLWNAHDESTAFLSERLHHYLQQNQPIDLALQQAKLDYFNSKIGKELDHPYYWANFILLGNAEPVNEDVGWAWWVWVGILFCGMLIGWKVYSTRIKGIRHEC